jgi:hypothetical protein
MAERSIFIPAADGPGLVKQISCRLTWHSGFAAVQKKKNIRALHEAAAAAGYGPLLEVSSKSDEKLGQHLSAFHLKVRSKYHGDVPLECAFQGSKVFEMGGPYSELYSVDPRTAKRDPRLRASGRIIAFCFDDVSFPIAPKTAFYDWLYITAIFPHRDWLGRLSRYAGFTDIEFNPGRSVNCQARACALFAALKTKELLEPAVQSPDAFVELLVRNEYKPESPSSAEALFN